MPVSSLLKRRARLARLLLPFAALGGLLALSGCYYGPYPYGYYGAPGYAYGPGVYARGGYGYYR